MARIDDIKKTLWPRAPYAPWLTANARANAADVYGAGLDVGALRATAARGVEVLLPDRGGWVPYIDSQHRGIANSFSRFGPGWSWGPNSASTHGAARGWYEDVEGKPPDAMMSADLQYSRELFLKYQRLYNEKHAASEEPKPKPQPEPTPIPVPTPTPSPVGLQPLSPAAVRAEEIRAMVAFLPEFARGVLQKPQFWAEIRPFLVEAIRAYRLWRRAHGDTRELPREDRP